MALLKALVLLLAKKIPPGEKGLGKYKYVIPMRNIISVIVRNINAMVCYRVRIIVV